MVRESLVVGTLFCSLVVVLHTPKPSHHKL